MNSTHSGEPKTIGGAGLGRIVSSRAKTDARARAAQAITAAAAAMVLSAERIMAGGLVVWWLPCIAGRACRCCVCCNWGEIALGSGGLAILFLQSFSLCCIVLEIRGLGFMGFKLNLGLLSPYIE